MKNQNRISPKLPIGSLTVAFEDDCPICRAEAQARHRGRELTVQEYIEAEQQAQREGALVEEITDFTDYRSH